MMLPAMIKMQISAPSPCTSQASYDLFNLSFYFVTNHCIILNCLIALYIRIGKNHNHTTDAFCNFFHHNVVRCSDNWFCMLQIKDKLKGHGVNSITRRLPEIIPSMLIEKDGQFLLLCKEEKKKTKDWIILSINCR